MHLLLGHLWKFDNNSTHHGRSNNILACIGARNILCFQWHLPKMLCDNEMAPKEKGTLVSSTEVIKLMGSAMILYKSKKSKLVNTTPCYALMCKSFSHNDVLCVVFPFVANILKDCADLPPSLGEHDEFWVEDNSNSLLWILTKLGEGAQFISSSSPFHHPGTTYTQIAAQTFFGLCFRSTTYVWKVNEITFPMGLVSRQNSF